MFTPFRDGLQSLFGGRVRTDDLLPAIEASAAAGIRYFEFGGGARFQAPYFYCGENPFEAMDKIKAAAGTGSDLQILTRSVSGVTLTTQGIDALGLQARMMAKHGTTIDRNFDYMNDVDNLVKTGKPIVEAGMHHQVCVALMGLPFKSNQVHTPEFYVDVVRRLLQRDIHIDSICLKDASGTTDPKTVYETAKGIREILSPEISLSMHTHDTASMGIACYMAGIEGGVDTIDLSVSPMSGGTVQPDVRAMAHALKGTGYSLDIDASKMDEIQDLLTTALADYHFNPVTTTPDPRVVNFPMPGGAIGPNVHMMEQAGILDKYSEVLAEFPVVVKAGGAWTSVTPGSQQYWLQAFNNVLHGRWKKIETGYGKAILGYFGRPPLPPDPNVVSIASEQLGLEPFDGDPLAAAPDSLAPAKAALEERGLETSDEFIFLTAAAIVPGKDMELNEGIRLLEGRAKITLPLKQTAKATPKPIQNTKSGPITTNCQVTENGHTRQFTITIAPPGTEISENTNQTSHPNTTPCSSNNDTPIHSPFEGTVEVVEISVREGEHIVAGQIIAAVEAMKAKHDVKAPSAGIIKKIHVRPGDEVSGTQAIITMIP